MKTPPPPIVTRGSTSGLHSSVGDVTPSCTRCPTPISTYEDLPPLSHELAGGFSAECEEEVAKLPPPTSRPREPRGFPGAETSGLCDRDLWSPVFRDLWSPFFVMSDFWRLSLHRLRALFTM